MAQTNLYNRKIDLIDEINFHVKDLATIEHLLSYLEISDYRSNRVLFSRSTILLEKVRANLARFSRELKDTIHD